MKLRNKDLLVNIVKCTQEIFVIYCYTFRVNVLKSTSSSRVQNTIENMIFDVILTRISRTVPQAMADMSQAFK